MKRRLFIIIAAMMAVSAVNAQDWKSVLGNIANKVGETVSQAKEEHSIEGTWQYTKPDCKFESDNFLSQAGGEVAAKKVEEEMAKHLSKLGFNEGTTYTFNADSTYTSTVGKRTTKGTYSYNKETKEITMKTRLGIKFKATLSMSPLAGGNKMSLLFKADKLMSLAQSITDKLSKNSSKSALSAVNSVLGEYDGLMLGFEMQKKQ